MIESVSVLWVVLAAGVGAAVAWLWTKRAKSAPSLAWPIDWQLSLRSIFNANEKHLYALLQEAYPRFRVFPKVPLVRFCQSLVPEQAGYWYDFLGSIHCTFVISTEQGRVLAAVDLVGETPGRKSRIREEALKACRIKHLQCKPDRIPSLSELRGWLPETLALGASASGAVPKVQEARKILAQTVKDKRAMRPAHPQDAQDSFFMHDSRFDELLPSAAAERDSGP